MKILNFCIHCGKLIEEGSICSECEDEDKEERERSYLG